MTAATGKQPRWPWQRFPMQELEEKYRRSLVGTNILHFRIAILVGLTLNVTYALWDRLVFTDALGTVTILREVVMTIYLLGFIPLTLVRAIQPHLNLLLGVACFGYAAFFGTINSLERTPYIFLANGVLIFIFPFLFGVGLFGMSVASGVVSSLPLLAIIAATRPVDGNFLLFALLIVGTLFTGSCVAALLETVRRRAFLLRQELEAERARFRDLLVRVLPDKIADRLQRGEMVADTHPTVVVLFADIVGFTSIAGRHAPDVVVSWLNTLFQKFDRVVEAHGLEKIKTIGDAYGCSRPRRWGRRL